MKIFKRWDVREGIIIKNDKGKERLVIEKRHLVGYGCKSTQLVTYKDLNTDKVKSCYMESFLKWVNYREV